MVSEGRNVVVHVMGEVLILVVVEDGLGDEKSQLIVGQKVVLILVVVEDGLGVLQKVSKESRSWS